MADLSFCLQGTTSEGRKLSMQGACARDQPRSREGTHDFEEAPHNTANWSRTEKIGIRQARLSGAHIVKHSLPYCRSSLGLLFFIVQFSTAPLGGST